MTITDPATIPPNGEFIIPPVYITKDRYIRESKVLDTETF